MISDSYSSDFFASDPDLSEVINKIANYETWVVNDENDLASMDESITKVLHVINSNYSAIKENNTTDEVQDLIEGMLIILGFMPVKKALYYLMAFQENSHFFEKLAVQLNSAPPLKSHAKTLLARANVIQQRELQKAVSSPENFLLLSQALERTFEKG
jgi:hypothetical protein